MECAVFFDEQTYSYLITRSNHPNFIHKNIPKGIFIRVRRICSSISDYFYNSIKIWKQLKSRGYDSVKVKAIIVQLANQDRGVLLIYKNKVPSEGLELGVVPFIYENIFHKFRENIKICIDKLALDFKYMEDYYNITHKMQPNIGALLINKIPSMLFELTDNYGYKPCNNIKCVVCPFNIKINDLWEFDGRFNSSLIIKNNSNCNSEGCVYIIYCTLCKYFYVGETGRKIHQRIYEHLYNIRKFIPYIRSTAVSLHFNIGNHNIEHFKYFIYDVNMDTHLRKFTEKKLIKLLIIQGMRLLNEDLSLPFFNTYKIR